MTSNIKSRYFGTRLIPLNALFFEQRGNRRLEMLQHKKDQNELISSSSEVTEMYNLAWTCCHFYDFLLLSKEKNKINE